MTTRSRLSDEDDAGLVGRAREGSPEALAELVHRHQGVLYRFLLARTGDEDLAADLAQDAFVKALGALGSFRGDASFRTWLLAIGRNELLGAHRRRARRREQGLDGIPDAVDPDPLPDQGMDQAGEMARLRGLMLRLPEKQRMSVWLRLHDGLSFREVAEATGSTEGAARVNYFHGIRKLREWADD